MVLILFTLQFLFAGEARREISLPLPADLKAFSKIRVLVSQNKSEVQVSCKTPFEVLDDKGNTVFQGPKLEGATVKPVKGGIRWWTETVPTNFLLLKTKNGNIQVGGKGLYADRILFQKNQKGSLDIINELDLESYLKSVIPFEANPLWSLEALKAQVVAARSFALFRMIERANAIYDVSSGVFSQVYVGKQIENPKTNQAVDETRGEILTYKGKIFPGYFHSTCGGRTTGADLVWDVKPIAPLSGVECKFCRKSPHYKWRTEISAQTIKEKMASNGGIPVQEVKSIELDKIDKSGRAHSLIIGSTWMEKTVDADAFRNWVDPKELKSTLITGISAQDGKFVFRGRGWGHGVGMCQYGMKYLGELGYSYHEILGYYYPGARVINLSEVKK